MPEKHSQPDGAPAPTTPLVREGVARLRVRYSECDPMGVAHHAAYPVWLEIARTEILRQCGVSYKELEAAGVLLVVVRLDLRYRRPARYDDELEIHCRLVDGGPVKLEHAYDVRRSTDGESLCAATSVLACVDREGKPRRMPEWLTHRGRAGL